MDVELLAAVARNCPSGAIQYRRKDAGLEEPPPPVNTLKVRENGPYAVTAQLRVAGADDGHRATLCRCGQSKRKPWCDGSHAEAGFVATGQPPQRSLDALATRDGPLDVRPQRNGPLVIDGPLELCAGTGGVFHRDTGVRLCRCGQSKTKPFCDSSHIAAGFVADGE
jgi:CDGSH-type Zn-finger protein